MFISTVHYTVRPTTVAESICAEGSRFLAEGSQLLAEGSLIVKNVSTGVARPRRIPPTLTPGPLPVFLLSLCLSILSSLSLFISLSKERGENLNKKKRGGSFYSLVSHPSHSLVVFSVYDDMSSAFYALQIFSLLLV